MKYREKTRKIFAVGVALGKLANGTAISFIELAESPSSPTDTPSDRTRFDVRHLQRFSPGTPFVDIAHSLSDRLATLELIQSKEETAFGTRDVDLTVLLVIDQTAAGSSVVDMILKTLRRPAWRVVISGSHSQGYSDGVYYIPESELTSILQAQTGWGLLKIGKDVPEMKALVEQLLQYQDRRTNTMVREDTWRDDDLVLAVALACWMLKQDTRFSYEFI